MANTGIITTSKASVPTGKYPKYINVYWSASQDAVLNRSTLTWTAKVGSDYDNDLWVAVGPTTVSFNGVATTIERKQGYKVTTKDCVLGTGTVVIDHEASGAKTVAVSVSSAMYSSSQNVSYSGSIVLDPIDRTAPVVTFNASGVTVNGFTVSAASTSVCDLWEYTVNGGASWTQFSTAEGTTASVSLSMLSPATTYNVAVRARKKSNQVKGTSAAKTIQTLGGAEVMSVTTLVADRPNATFDVALRVYQAYPVDVAVTYNSATLLTRTALTVTVGTTTLTITPTSQELNAIYAAMPNDRQIAATVTVTSKDGGTVIQTSTTTFPIQISSAAAPSISGWTYEQGDTTISTLLGTNSIFVQRYSVLGATLGTVTAYRGASIVGRTLQLGNTVVYFNDISDTAVIMDADMSGTVSAVVTVTDSRGYATSMAKNLTFLPWKPVRVNVTKLRRANGVDADIELAFQGTLSALTVSGTQKNHVTAARYRIRETSASTWGAWTSILSGITENGESFSFESLQLTQLDPMKSYALQLEVDDELSGDIGEQYSETFVVAQGMPVIEIVQGGVVINGNLTVNGNLTINGEETQNFLGILSGEGDVDNCYVIGDSVPQTEKKYHWGTLILEGGLGVICHVSGRATCEVLFNGVAQTLTSGTCEILPWSNYTVTFEYTSSVSRITIVTEHD